jgi:hypothetical protein
MERYCSTGQSSQQAVAPTEEQKEQEEEEEKKKLLHVSATGYGYLQGATNLADIYSIYCSVVIRSFIM